MPPKDLSGQTLVMAKPKPRAVPIAISPRIRVTWRTEVALGPGKAELLVLIKETGSIHEAAKRMGMSYMRAWTLIQTMNRCFREPVVQAARGGRGGGGAELTAIGNRALDLYQEMEKASTNAIQPAWRNLKKLLTDATHH